MARNEEPAELGECEVVNTSGLALLVNVDGKEVWIPFSQIDESSELTRDSEAGDKGDLVVTAWIARERGLV